MNDLATCACGHVGDEHGHDPDHPGSTACNVEVGKNADGLPILCECIAFEEADDPSGSS